MSWREEKPGSNHLSGANLKFSADDARLDLTDVFAFLAPDNPARCIVILDTNPFATGSEFHPDAVYRINVDNDDDALTDVAISAVFSSPTGGQQTATVYLTTGEQAKQPEALGEAIIEAGHPIPRRRKSTDSRSVPKVVEAVAGVRRP